MHFGENQLSRSLIGLSPLPTAHPPSFQPRWVGPPHALTRASTWPWVDHPASGPERATTHRPIRTRSRYGYPTRVKPRDTPLTRRLILQKARHHPPHNKCVKALTACKRPVSGTISLPSRGTFHHSLTVLSTIGHQEVFRQPSGLGRFTQDSTSPVLLGWPHHGQNNFDYGTLTLYGRPFQVVHLPS